MKLLSVVIALSTTTSGAHLSHHGIERDAALDDTTYHFSFLFRIRFSGSTEDYFICRSRSVFSVCYYRLFSRIKYRVQFRINLAARETEPPDIVAIATSMGFFLMSRHESPECESSRVCANTTTRATTNALKRNQTRFPELLFNICESAHDIWQQMRDAPSYGA